MPKVPIRKAKRVSVLTKRAQCLGKHYKERSYRPLYEKLKNNNSFLAKALSQEKQNNQSLFTQNVELIAKIQQLHVVCNTRNTVISNVMNNAKEVLKMLISMTGYMTNTISMCQEIAASNNTMRLSSASTGRKESSKRLSTKSPAKGVVKPMVGGLTITKPTINLSRVNMERINNISRLSDIQEVSPSNRSQEINESRSSIVVPLPTTPLRYENGHTCRMPERLPVISPRVNAEEERLRRRNYRTKRLTESYSRSRSRWSDETPINTGCINIIDNRVDGIENRESSDNLPHDSSDTNVIIPETQVSINPDEEDETHTHTSKKDSSAQINNKISDKDFNKNPNITGNSRLPQNNARNWEEEDPLEGPSWLFNNTMPSRDNEPEELDHLHVSDVNNNTSQIIVYDDDSSDTESNTEESPLLPNINEPVSDTQTSEGDAAPIADHNGYESYLHEHDANGSFCGILPAASNERNLHNMEDSNAQDGTTDFASFVTVRRGHSEATEETEDFTLMLSRQPTRNMQFDINELRMPVLEESVIDPAIDSGIDTEVTTAIRSSVTNIPMPSVSNRSLNKTIYDQITIKLPIIVINDHERVSTLQQKKHSNKRSKKGRLPNSKNGTSHTENASPIKSKAKQRNKSGNNRDPSTAKVVLEKLNECHVKPRSSTRRSSGSSTESRNTNNQAEDTVFNEDENARDSGGSTNTYASNRPRRRKAPVNLKEPDLHKKLRRN